LWWGVVVLWYCGGEVVRWWGCGGDWGDSVPLRFTPAPPNVSCVVSTTCLRRAPTQCPWVDMLPQSPPHPRPCPSLLLNLTSKHPQEISLSNPFKKYPQENSLWNLFKKSSQEISLSNPFKKSLQVIPLGNLLLQLNSSQYLIVLRTTPSALF
jgi:hypothetical protein